jgi:hypothetical protein
MATQSMYHETHHGILFNMYGNLLDRFDSTQVSYGTTGIVVVTDIESDAMDY